MATTTGILAYGSLLEAPGPEIAKAKVDVIRDVLTPFKVEFARSSKGRSGAPTLVPVETGGAQVKASIFVVNLSVQEAKNCLYRREINEVGSGESYKEPEKITANKVLIKTLTGLGGIEAVLYTDIAANIEPLTAEHLAALAIASAKSRDDGRDGITYLIDAQRHSIHTVLSEAYAAEILRQTGAGDLQEALAQVRSKR